MTPLPMHTDANGPKHSMRFIELDSLRGLAALSVVFGHFLHVFPDSAQYATIHRWEAAAQHTPIYAAYAGHEAVILFFMLSGFVLSLPLLQGKPMEYPGYVIRRIFRIYVPYLFAVLVSCGLALACYRGPLPELSEWANRSWSNPAMVQSLRDHLLFLGSFDGSRINPVVWSLVHEMRISLFYPFVVLLMLRGGWKTALLSATAVSITSVVLNKALRPATDYLYTFHYLGIFMIGFLLARHRAGLCAWFQSKPAWFKCCVLATGLSSYVYGKEMKFVFLQDWVTAVGAAVFIMVAISSLKLSRFLHLAPVRFLGETSYSLYLYHAAILLAVVHLGYTKLPIALLLTAVLALSLLAAWISYQCIELPAIRAGKKLAGLCLRWLQSTPPQWLASGKPAPPASVPTAAWPQAEESRRSG